MGGKGWQTARSRHGLFGNIRALEVTHGENGWHPHLHVLILFKPGTTERDIAAFSAWLYKRWASRIRHQGFGDCAPGAFTFVIVDEPHGAAGYLAKWGAAHEMTKAHAKRGRVGRTPWQILADCADGNERDIALFRDYAAAFKGSRQLTWSRGLRQHYALATEAPDEALAGQAPEPATPIAAFTRPLWKKILKVGLAVEVLIAADHGGVAGIKVLLQRYTVRTSIRFQLSHDGQNMIMIFSL